MKDILVLIANCHGENTPGKRSPDNILREWKWGRELNKLIIEKLYNLGIQTITINPEDKEVKLSEQVRRVNKYYDEYKNEYKNIILISPHVNASSGNGWTNASGWTVFVSKNASEKSKKLAKILSHIAYDEMNLKGDRWLPYERIFTANYYILKNTKCPAVLSENMFMTNHKDVDYLLSDKGKQELSDLHVKGIQQFIEIYK